MTLPLSGIIVLDLSRARAGPTATRQLADWGAEVVRIEMPGSLDEADVVSSSRDSGDFQNLHRNKKSIAINLKTPDGMAVFKRLVQRADVVVENFRPNVKHKLGIDQDSLIGINPRLIYASISGFGETGPYQDRPGVDQIIQGISGLMSVTGDPEQGPMRAGIAVADVSAGVFCAYGILLALFSRERTGRGQWVSTSLLQSMIFMLDFQAARWLVDGVLPKQAGNNHPTAIPMGVFPTADGAINIAASGQKLWRRFCEATKLDDLLVDPKYETSQLRSRNRAQLNVRIGELTCTKSSAHWVKILNDAGIPAGPINNIQQMFDDPQVQHLGMVRDVPTTKGTTIRLVEQPVRMSATQSRLDSGAPDNGQHTRQVLGEAGFSTDEIDRYIHTKAIG